VTLGLLRLSLSGVVSRKSGMDQPGVVPDLFDTEQKTHLTFQAAVRWVGFTVGPAVPPPLLIRQTGPDLLLRTVAKVVTSAPLAETRVLL
jgi:hypothetical protein